MAQVKNGLILPEHADILQLYLSQAKDESTYISNDEIAKMIYLALPEEDVRDIAEHLEQLTTK